MTDIATTDELFFTRTGMDAICLGNYVVCKPQLASKLQDT